MQLRKFYDANASENGGGASDAPDTTTDNKQDEDIAAAETPAPAAAPALKGQADQATIDGWKKKYPQGIYGIAVKGDSIIYFRKPDRADMNCALAKKNSQAFYDMFEMLADITCIGGAKELLQDDQAFFSVANYMEGMQIGYTAALVNL